MTLGRAFTMFLLLYLAADYCDPLVPGVFFFENDQLFMDGLVVAQTSVTTPATYSAPTQTVQPTDPSGTPDLRLRLVRAAVLSRWRPIKRDCSASPAQFPEDH